ncbi:MAG: hypothetical protein R2750_06000 [Bacteroidales bacterium]
MKDSFTLSDLIHYSNSDDLNDDEMEDYQHENQATCQSGPDERIIDNILKYSLALNVIKTKMAGNINLLMN